MGNRRGIQTQSGRSMTMGANDPRARRDPIAESNPDIQYSAPLSIDRSGRLQVEIGEGIVLSGGKLTVDMDYVRAQLGL